MTLHVEGFAVKEVLLDDFPTDEQFQGERREHVESEAEPRDVDQGIVLGITEVSKPI